MPRFMRGIHVFATFKGVDGPDKPGHDDIWKFQ
jgi:hypothetical protein